MSLSREQVEQIPEVFRDFMLVLQSIPETRGLVLQIHGLQLGEIFTYLRKRHDYNPFQIRSIADNLKKAGLVEENQHGFFKPTSRGESLIESIEGIQAPIPETVPDLPDLAGF